MSGEPNIVIDEKSLHAPVLGGPGKGIQALEEGAYKTPSGIPFRLATLERKPGTDTDNYPTRHHFKKKRWKNTEAQ